MKKLEHDLLTNKYTEVFHEEDYKFNAPHHFDVVATAYHGKDPILNEVGDPIKTIIQQVHFQEGPIKEYGVNGVCNEDLIAMVIARLEGFQNSEFRCRDNAMAITKLEEALLWLRKRTIGRENRGVEGTHQK
jgi:hypothetical protein